MLTRFRLVLSLDSILTSLVRTMVIVKVSGRNCRLVSLVDCCHQFVIICFFPWLYPVV